MKGCPISTLSPFWATLLSGRILDSRLQLDQRLAPRAPAPHAGTFEHRAGVDPVNLIGSPGHPQSPGKGVVPKGWSVFSPRQHTRGITPPNKNRPQEESD